MVSAVLRDFVVERSVRIDETKALTVLQIAADHGFEEFGFPGARGADDVRVSFALIRRKANRLLQRIVAEEQMVHKYSRNSASVRRMASAHIFSSRIRSSSFCKLAMSLAISFRCFSRRFWICRFF